MPDIKELEYQINNIFEKLIYDKINPAKLRLIKRTILNKFVKLVKVSEFGKLYVKKKSVICKAFEKVESWWEEEYWEWETLIEDAVARVIEGAKEDVAEKRGVEPEEVEESELDDEVLWRWFGDEWSHNVKDRHWMAAGFQGRRELLNLQRVKQAGLESAVLSELVYPYENAGTDFVEILRNIIKEVDKKVVKSHVIKWAFGYKDYPIEW